MRFVSIDHLQTTKCSGTLPCLYCSRNHKSCVFARPPPRTPLTRKLVLLFTLDHLTSKISRNLEELENRSANLERLLQKLNPDVDIERALRTVKTPGNSNDSSPEVQRCSEPARENAPSTDKFEWNESSMTSPSQTDDLDGMASLPTRTTGSGYLGDTI